MQAELHNLEQTGGRNGCNNGIKSGKHIYTGTYDEEQVCRRSMIRCLSKGWESLLEGQGQQRIQGLDRERKGTRADVTITQGVIEHFAFVNVMEVYTLMCTV